MAGVSLTVTDDLGRIVSRLETAIAGVDDFRPMWRRLAPAWEARGREMFRTQGRSTGSPWPQYEDTAEREFYQWYKAGILRRDVTQLRPLTWTPGREVLRPSFESVRHPAAVYDARRRTLDRFDRPFVLAVAEASREHALTAERTIDPSAKAAPGGRGIGLTSRDVNALLGAA
jgi:hypothetical protein